MTIEELAASWDEKAARWRRTAKQQRSACRTGDGAKVRLLEKAQLAEDCARELREVAAESANLSDGGLRGLTSASVILDSYPGDANAGVGIVRPGKRRQSVGTISVDLESKVKKFDADIERTATLVDGIAREPTVDGGVAQTDLKPEAAISAEQEILDRLGQEIAELEGAEFLKTFADDLPQPPAPPRKGNDSVG